MSLLFRKRTEKKQVLSVEGMMCEHCALHVEEALKTIDGVTSVKVDLKKKSATITSETGIKDEILSASITEAGYILTGVK
jgi:copper chaperone CopZ